MLTTLLFSGQGTQHYGMGIELFRRSPVFRGRLLALDKVAECELGRSLVALLYGGTPASEPFTQLPLSTAAIVMVELAAAAMWMAENEGPIQVMGASLGMYAAASVAGCLAPDEALRAAISMARIVDAQCPAGVMAAVLATPDVLAGDPHLSRHAELAGVNAPGICVLSFTEARAPAVFARLREMDLTTQRLPVSRAFHSDAIDGAETACMALLNRLPLATPRMPLISCAHGRPLASIVPAALWETLRLPIQFAKCMQGLEQAAPHHYVDLGPAGTLATLLKYNLAPASASTVEAPLSSTWTAARQVAHLALS
jgi:acyl transferase domain-containing protein